MKTTSADARTRLSYATGNHQPGAFTRPFGWEDRLLFYTNRKTKTLTAKHDPEVRDRIQSQIRDLQRLDKIISQAQIAKPILTCYPDGRIEMRWPNHGKTLWVVREAGEQSRYKHLVVPDRKPMLVTDPELWQYFREPSRFLHRDLPALVHRHTGRYGSQAWFAAEHRKQVGPWTIVVRDEPDETHSTWSVEHCNAGAIAWGRAESRREAQREAQDIQERIAQILEQPGHTGSRVARVLRAAAAEAMAE